MFKTNTHNTRIEQHKKGVLLDKKYNRSSDFLTNDNYFTLRGFTGVHIFFDVENP